jgi:hypothetical protein
VDPFKIASKGEVVRGAVVSFKTAISAYLSREFKKNPNLTEAEASGLADKVRGALAKKLNKPVSALTEVDLLDPDTLNFKLYDRHYHEGIGYFRSRLGMDGPEGDAVWGSIAAPKQTVMCLILVYPTNKQGDMDKARMKTGWEIKPWSFSRQKYLDLLKSAKSLSANGISLAGQDILIECVEPEYQQYKFEAGGPAEWRKDPDMKSAVLHRAVKMLSHLELREISTDELRTKLGLPPPKASAGSPIGGLDVDNYDQHIEGL